MSDYPTLPPELAPTDPEILDELPRLWKEVCEELLDKKYLRRSHHNRKTYEVGCRGPLCTKANRDHKYRLSSSDIIWRTKSRRFDVVLLFFMIEAEGSLIS